MTNMLTDFRGQSGPIVYPHLGYSLIQHIIIQQTGGL